MKVVAFCEKTAPTEMVPSRMPAERLDARSWRITADRCVGLSVANRVFSERSADILELTNLTRSLPCRFSVNLDAHAAAFTRVSKQAAFHSASQFRGSSNGCTE